MSVVTPALQKDYKFPLDELTIMLSKSGTQPKALDESQLVELIQEALEADVVLDCSATIETLHARFDHLEREIDINDVLHGLESKWAGVGNPQFDVNFWQWKYPILTHDVEGGPITVLVAVDTKNRRFEVITKWRGH